MKRCFVLILLLSAVSASAQDTAGAVAAVRQTAASELASGATFTPDRYIDYLAALGNRRGALLKLMQQYEEQRSDKQVGATSAAAGTTTLVSKGTTPKILGLAVENGAVSRDQSGTTVTFRTNLGGAIRALAGNGYLDLAPINDPAVSILNRLSVSASFDTARGNTDGVLTADAQQLSQWTARVALWNARDVQNRGVIQRLSVAAGPSLLRHAANVTLLRQAVPGDTALTAWITATSTRIEAARGKRPAESDEQYASRLAGVLEEAERAFPINSDLTPATRLALGAYDASSVDFALNRDRLIAAVNNGLLATLEYTNDRPAKGPRLSNIQAVAEIGGTVDLTVNVAGTLYDSIPAGLTKRIRDYQASVQFDVAIGSPETIGTFIVSLAGKYVRQLEDSVDDSGLLIPGSKGATGFAQLKLTIPTKGAGVKVPLSLTWASRTELIKEKNIIRANVGLSYDLDTLFARFKPGL